MQGTSFSLRLAGPGDVAAIARTVDLGLESYRAFAPDNWEPPADETHGLLERLGDPAVWCQVAESDGEPVGHVALMPAAIHGGWPEPDPGLAHLWQLFVREPFWGSGVATTLHTAVIEEARRRGFARFRLFTPAAQARARRFYEREGWALAAPPFFEESFGMDLVEYRRPLRFTRSQQEDTA
jgi:GNAT superfamily N-acetyltransferase